MIRLACLAGVLLLAHHGLASPVHKQQHVRNEPESRFDPFHDECEINEDERVQCGAKTYDEQTCRQRSCCFQPCEGCNASIPWCFGAKRMFREECRVAYEDKDDCGYYGIMEGECMMRGCCWRPSHLPNDPPCFHGVSVRLVNGPQEGSGRVEIRHEGEWGTVCDDNFGQEEANVVCRSLGYESGIPKGYATYGSGSGPILLDGLSCNGDEARLEDCRHNGWGVHDCGHSEDSGVDCTNDPPVGPYPSYEPYTYEPYTYESYSYYDSYRNGGAGKAGKAGKGKSRVGFAGKPGKKREAGKNAYAPFRGLKKLFQSKKSLGKKARGMKAGKH